MKNALVRSFWSWWLRDDLANYLSLQTTIVALDVHQWQSTAHRTKPLVSHLVLMTDCFIFTIRHVIEIQIPPHFRMVIIDWTSLCFSDQFLRKKLISLRQIHGWRWPSRYNFLSFSLFAHSCRIFMLLLEYIRGWYFFLACLWFDIVKASLASSVQATLAWVLRLYGLELLLGDLWIDFAKNRHWPLAKSHRCIWTVWILCVCFAFFQCLKLIGRYSYASLVGWQF